MTRRGYRHSKASPFGEVWDRFDGLFSIAESFRLAVAVGGLLAAGIVTTFTFWLAPDEPETTLEFAAVANEGEVSADHQSTEDRETMVQTSNSAWGEDQADSNGWRRR